MWGLVSRSNQEEELGLEGTARHRVHGDVHWSGPAKLARDQDTGSAGSGDELECDKLDRDQHRGYHLPKVKRGEGAKERRTRQVAYVVEFCETIREDAS